MVDYLYTLFMEDVIIQTPAMMHKSVTGRAEKEYEEVLYNK